MFGQFLDNDQKMLWKPTKPWMDDIPILFPYFNKPEQRTTSAVYADDDITCNQYQAIEEVK